MGNRVRVTESKRVTNKELCGRRKDELGVRFRFIQATAAAAVVIPSCEAVGRSGGGGG